MLIESAVGSTIVQVITAIIDVWGLTSFETNDRTVFLKKLLGVELGVQTIELTFYIWLLWTMRQVSVGSIAKHRYADWFFTTPLMLITLMAYLSYNTTSGSSGIWSFVQSNWRFVSLVVVLNALMLIFGFIGEISNGIVWKMLGLVPFLLYFTLIYAQYVKPLKETDYHYKYKNYIFVYFFLFWSLYGVGSFLSPRRKNTLFNVLDLFAKNAFGLFLVFLIQKEE